MSILQADVLIIGAGISGLQAAIDLAEQNYKVIIVEQDPSIGGRMINLSKVFPTLDCASCITTPKMAAVHHHANITVMTYSEVASIDRSSSTFKVSITKKPRFLNEETCIGCKRCEEVCPVYIPDNFEHGLGASKAIAIPFTNAIPQYPVLKEEFCIKCKKCAQVCPTKCIDYEQKSVEILAEVKSVIIATGFNLTPVSAKKQYGYGEFINVLSPMQAERLLAPHGPFGAPLRPSDGKIPDSIAYVQCASSRDKSLDVPYCSRVCCMYAIKQAMLLSGSLPIADITIYYMDIRAFGKGYEQFYQTAKAMGISFVKAKVASIKEVDDKNLVLRIERQEADSNPEEVTHDLVVLSQGLASKWTVEQHKLLPIEIAEDGFIKQVALLDSPNITNLDGIFACGVSTGPKDIVDSIVDASSAAMAVNNYLKQGALHV